MTDRQTAEGRLCPRGSQNILSFNYSLVECCSMNECIRMNSEWTRLCLLILRFLQLEPAALEQTVSFRLTLAQITPLVEASTSIPGLLVHYPPPATRQTCSPLTSSLILCCRVLSEPLEQRVIKSHCALMCAVFCY